MVMVNSSFCAARTYSYIYFIISIDVVDTTFNYMDIENEFCRMKSICEMESFAANNPIAKLAINTVK